MKVRNILKKTLAVVLAFAMVAPLMGNLASNVKEVKDQANDAFLQWDARAYSKSSTHNNVAVWDTGTTWTANNIFQGGNQNDKLQQNVSNALLEIK